MKKMVKGFVCKEQTMKILKKAKILPCECEKCGSIFQPNWKDVRHGDFTYCPMCGVPTSVSYEKGVDNEQI